MKMTKTKHTPTPWEIKEGWSGHIFGPNHEMISRAMDCRKSSAQENAAFIVRAVNSHEALLEVAKDLVKLEADRLKGFLKRDDYECRMATARKIIAQVV